MAEMPPILVADLFRELGVELIRLLIKLTPDEWHRPTISSRRNVKDIVSHLLDGSLRRLSRQRDAYLPPDGSCQPAEGEELVDFLNRMNSQWEIATRRLSPHVLVGLLEWAHGQVAILFESLDPFAPAIFPVAWAGERESLNWMDVAREYTEKWHHTQQIFEATGRPSKIIQRRLFHPCLDTFMRALPCTFRDVDGPVGIAVAVVINGEAGGEWFIERTNQGWQQKPAVHGEITSTVTMDQNSAWKLVTKRRDRAETTRLFPDIRIEGDQALGNHVLDMVSVMA